DFIDTLSNDKTMAHMKQKMSIKADQIKNQSLPESCGTLTLYGSEGELYTLYCGNLRRKWQFLSRSSEDDRVIKEVLDQTTSVAWTEAVSLVEALADHKFILKNSTPLYQQQLFPPRDYVYLALSAEAFPFVRISEHTTEDWQYLGPFRSRFFLTDFIDSLSRILKLPHCEQLSFPCEKFDRDLCRGWCLSLNTEREIDSTRDLEKLQKLLFESYMTPSDSVIKLLRTQYDTYFDNLEFEKAEMFTEPLEIHRKYKDWLEFLIATKSLNFQDQNYKVVDGQLAAALIEGEWHDLHILRTEFRPNELLALDKAVVDEARVIYDYYKTKIEVL
ncbi:MAG TPA: hypothetical protein PL124_09160, partial [Candidatus Cloacimonadota bacterium]|nr:hypothetical protein [Candidatus Cloacimonadota bacterium]